MSVLISTVKMEKYDDRSIPGVVTLTFTNGEEATYQRSDHNYSSLVRSKKQLEDFSQPKWELEDQKIDENTFEALSTKYTEQLCALNDRYKSAFEEAERLYAQENLAIDNFRKAQRVVIEQVWQRMSREMYEKYQSLKKKVDSWKEGLKDPEKRLGIMVSWLRGTKVNELHKAAQMLETEAGYILKKVASPDVKWDSFLSHVQMHSADVSRNIKDTLLKKGMTLWYDKSVDRLDNYGMIDGVVNSSLFTIILTTDYFSRPYCVFEYCIAVVAGKKIITVSECDPRHGGGRIGSFKLPPIFNHILKHELIEINRTYWEAFIDKLYKRIKWEKFSFKWINEIPNSKTDFRSSILGESEITWLCEELFKEQLVFGNILFTTMRFGNTAQSFHSKCDHQGATLTVVETTNGDVFGGYTSRSWASSGGHTKAKSAWLFKLRDGPFRRIDIKPGQPAVYFKKTYGPTFGEGHDLKVYPAPKKGGTNYCKALSYAGGIFSNQSKKIHFDVKKYEVFQILNYSTEIRKVQ